MNPRCPECHTAYNVDPETLLAAGGKARCHHCGTIFNAFDLDTAPPAQHEQAKWQLAGIIQDDEKPGSSHPSADIDDLDLILDVGPEPDTDLPFEVPDDLPTLEPADHDPKGSGDNDRTSRHTRWWQGPLLLLLIVALGMQLAWFHRDTLLRRPQAQPLCQWLDCSVAHRSDPTAFSVIERQLGADPAFPGALSLQIRFRNTAPYAQPLPRLQLSLYDNSGDTLARRLFSVDEYLFPSPGKNTLAAPQEVFTIELLLEDPGTRASGFKIDFL